MANKSKGHQPKRRDALLGTFATRRANPSLPIFELKSDRSYRQAKQIIRDIQFYHLDAHLYGDRKAQDWNKVLIRPVVGLSRDWVQEFGWLAHGFKTWSPFIVKFRAQRKRFGAAYLLADYAAAQTVLDEILSEHGLSFWWAERQLMLHQASAGFEKHKQCLADLQRSVADPLVSYLITMLSNRLEPHITHDAFNDSVQRETTALRKDGHGLLASLIEIQVSPWTFGWKSDLREMLWWCARRPLIDRYNTALKILSVAAFTVSEKPGGEHLMDILRDLQACIDDPQLIHIEWAAFGQMGTPSYDSATNDYLICLDHFLTGNYEECARSAEALVMKDPTSFDSCWLLARALACSSGERKLRLDERSLSWRIVSTLLDIAENRKDLNIPVAALRALALSLGDNHLGLSLWQLAERESGEISDDACRYALIKSKVHSLESLNNQDVAYRTSCLNHLTELYPSHPSLGFYRYTQSGDIQSELPNEIAPAFKNIAHAERAVANQKYEEALNWVDPHIDNGEVTDSEKQFLSLRAAPIEFDALLELGRPLDAAACVVRHYIVNPNALRHVPFEQLIEGARPGKWDSLRSSIFWPVLVFLNAGDEQDVYEAVDDFLASQQYQAPGQLLDHLQEFPTEAVRVLLREVLVPPVLSRGALWAKTPEEQRQLRTKFLQALYALNVQDQELVINELSELDRARGLEEAYRNVEGPKFFLEFSDVNKTLATLLEGTFERYCAYRAYEVKGGQLVAENDLLALAKHAASSKHPPEKKDLQPDKRSETSEVMLSTIASLVFNQYLWHSTRGLNATLSTRIRHGSLENQFKRVFGAHGMLATKDLQGEYQCNHEVLYRLSSSSEETRRKVIVAYIRFTTEINAIYQGLVSSSLRIKIPGSVVALLEQDGLPMKDLANERGLLDFTAIYGEATLGRLKTLQIASISALLTELQQMFVVKAEATFATVRQFLEASVQAQVTALIQELDAVVSTTVEEPYSRANLRNGILAAKEEFVRDLRIFEKWFSTAAKIDMGLGSVAQIITTTARVVDFASNGRLGHMVESSMEDHEVLPEIGLVLYEVISILLRNIVQHSGVQTGQRVEYSYVLNARGKHCLSFSNKMAGEAACTTAVARANASISMPKDPRALDRSPGGTGLARILALLGQIRNGPIDLQCRAISGERFLIRIEY